MFVTIKITSSIVYGKKDLAKREYYLWYYDKFSLLMRRYLRKIASPPKIYTMYYGKDNSGYFLQIPDSVLPILEKRFGKKNIKIEDNELYLPLLVQFINHDDDGFVYNVVPGDCGFIK